MKDYQRLVLEEFRAKLLLNRARVEICGPLYVYGSDDVLILLNSEIAKLK